MEWYIAVLKKYAVFKGRARRKEYWMFLLCNGMINIAFNTTSQISGLGFLAGVSFVYSLAILVPYIAVSVRRLHDTNRKGILCLLMLIPIVGLIIMLIFAAQKGTKGPNDYGPDPKEN